MLHSPWIAALIALFLWWFSTGAILLAVRRADKEGAGARLWAVLWNLPVLDPRRRGVLRHAHQ
jgi:hypothetical protein